MSGSASLEGRCRSPAARDQALLAPPWRGANAPGCLGRDHQWRFESTPGNCFKGRLLASTWLTCRPSFRGARYGTGGCDVVLVARRREPTIRRPNPPSPRVNAHSGERRPIHDCGRLQWVASHGGYRARYTPGALPPDGFRRLASTRTSMSSWKCSAESWTWQRPLYPPS
jgi:hypothetical protein